MATVLDIEQSILLLELEAPFDKREVQNARRKMAKRWHPDIAPLIEVDPGELHLPPTRAQGADPGKLARQIAKHGDSLDGMPPIHVVRGKGGHLRINDGVTRATRAAKLRPGVRVPAEVIQELPRLDVTRMPKVKDRL